MLFNRLFGSRPIQPKVRFFDRQVLGHKPTVKDGAVIAHAEPTATLWGLVREIGGTIQESLNKTKFA